MNASRTQDTLPFEIPRTKFEHVRAEIARMYAKHGHDPTQHRDFATKVTRAVQSPGDYDSHFRQAREVASRIFERMSAGQAAVGRGERVRAAGALKAEEQARTHAATRKKPTPALVSIPQLKSELFGVYGRAYSQTFRGILDLLIKEHTEHGYVRDSGALNGAKFLIDNGIIEEYMDSKFRLNRERAERLKGLL